MGPADVDLFHLTDDPEEAVNLIAESDRAAMGRPTKHARGANQAAKQGAKQGGKERAKQGAKQGNGSPS